MTDEFRAHSNHPEELKRQFKLIGTDPVTGEPVYATVMALEPASIGGGGGPSSSVTIADATISTQKAAVSAAGAIKVDGSSVTQPVSGTFFQTTQPVSGPLTDTQLRASAVPVSGPLTDTQLRASAVPVSGTFFPGTQPVSLAAAVDVSDRAARLLGHVTVDNASLAVTGTFWQATQPISAASLPLPTGAATAANQSTVKAASTVAAAADTASVVQHSPQRADGANLAVTVTAATGVAATLTIPAAGAGLFHYISLIEIQLYATAARTGGATPVLVTTTNLPAAIVWDFDTAQAIGNTIRQSTQPATPIKSAAANTATTIVAPIATTGIWRINAYYYAAP